MARSSTLKNNFTFDFMIFLLFLFISFPQISTFPDPRTRNCSQGSDDCQNFGYCNHQNVCDFGHFGSCDQPGSRVVRPNVYCSNETICEGTNRFCDLKRGICCSIGDSKLGKCPNKLTYYLLEPKCGNSTKEECSPGGFCYRGHCCPGHKTNATTVIPQRLPYLLSIKCLNNMVPKYRNLFCSRPEQRIGIWGKRKMDGSKNWGTGMKCRSNENCSPRDVCVFRGDFGSCMENPLHPPEAFLFYETAEGIGFYVILATTVLTFGIVCLLNKWKFRQYYAYDRPKIE